MTPQEVFAKVVTHLRKQNAVSAKQNGMCVYRGPNGMKCAVGCLIPDDVYKPEMECGGVGVLFMNFPETAKEIGKDNIHLLRHLQTIHDQYSPLRWETAFLSVSDEYNLEMPPR